jgi:hypothetical protein
MKKVSAEPEWFILAKGSKRLPAEYWKSITRDCSIDSDPSHAAFVNWVLEATGLGGTGVSSARSLLRLKSTTLRRGAIIVYQDVVGCGVGFLSSLNTARGICCVLSYNGEKNIFTRDIVGIKWPK